MKQKINELLKKRWARLVCCVLSVLIVFSIVGLCFVKVNESYDYLEHSCSFCECNAVYRFPIENNKKATFCPDCFASYLSENPDELYKLYSSSRYAF